MKLCDLAKAVRREKFITIKAYLKKLENSQLNNLNLYLKELVKEDKAQSEQNKVGRGQDQREINEIETKKE